MKDERREREERDSGLYTMKSEGVTFNVKKMKNHTKLDFLLKLI